MKQPYEYEESHGLTTKTVKGGDGAPFWQVHRHIPKGEPEHHRKAARAVLLIHAATLGRRMFMEPAGGFLSYLLAQEKDKKPKFDVYTLDWRSSNLLFGNSGEGGKGKNFPDYRVDQVANVDVTKGIRAVANHRRVQLEAPPDELQVHVVAHCMGAAATAQALATTPSDGEELPVGNVVLATIALFYRLGVDGWLKLADDNASELESPPGRRDSISPHVAYDPDPVLKWPDKLEGMFELWRETVLAHGCESPFCDRLWFLYGGDYRALNMLALHDSVGPDGLRAQFGAMPVGLYRHIIDNCRRGWAAPWDTSNNREKDLMDPARFANRSITLVTGAENQVWHRDSIDRMYEWLRRKFPKDEPASGQVFRKIVFPRYGHLDLWWSSEAPRDVFPTLVQALSQ